MAFNAVRKANEQALAVAVADASDTLVPRSVASPESDSTDEAPARKTGPARKRKFDPGELHFDELMDQGHIDSPVAEIYKLIQDQMSRMSCPSLQKVKCLLFEIKALLRSATLAAASADKAAVSSAAASLEEEIDSADEAPARKRPCRGANLEKAKSHFNELMDRGHIDSPPTEIFRIIKDRMSGEPWPSMSMIEKLLAPRKKQRQIQLRLDYLAKVKPHFDSIMQAGHIVSTVTRVGRLLQEHMKGSGVPPPSDFMIEKLLKERRQQVGYNEPHVSGKSDTLVLGVEAAASLEEESGSGGDAGPPARKPRCRGASKVKAKSHFDDIMKQGHTHTSADEAAKLIQGRCSIPIGERDFTVEAQTQNESDDDDSLLPAGPLHPIDQSDETIFDDIKEFDMLHHQGGGVASLPSDHGKKSSLEGSSKKSNVKLAKEHFDELVEKYHGSLSVAEIRELLGMGGLPAVTTVSEWRRRKNRQFVDQSDAKEHFVEFIGCGHLTSSPSQIVGLLQERMGAASTPSEEIIITWLMATRKSVSDLHRSDDEANSVIDLVDAHMSDAPDSDETVDDAKPAAVLDLLTDSDEESAARLDAEMSQTGPGDSAVAATGDEESDGEVVSVSSRKADVDVRRSTRKRAPMVTFISENSKKTKRELEGIAVAAAAQAAAAAVTEQEQRVAAAQLAKKKKHSFKRRPLSKKELEQRAAARAARAKSFSRIHGDVALALRKAAFGS